ncbi:MAG: TolC family protein [Planctomycetota bacterium]
MSPSPVLIPSRLRTSAALTAVLALGACRSAGPAPRPLEPQRRLDVLAAERAAHPVPEGPLSVAALKDLFRAHHPGVRAARAAATARRRGAAVASRPRNPTVSLGPFLFGGVDILESAAWGVEAALGWAVPLAPTRQLDDRARRAEADIGLVEAAATERAAWLEACAALVDTHTAERRAAARAEAALAADARLALARRAADAGEADAFSVAVLDVEAARARRARNLAHDEARAAREAFAVRLGLTATALERALLPQPETAPTRPELAALERGLARSRAEVAVLVTRYEHAERRLRAEVARGLPDLEIESSLEHDESEDRFGLIPSFEVPLWDQNQVGVAAACAERNALRAELDGVLGTALGELETAWRRLEAARARAARLDDELAPAVGALVAASEARREAGTVDALTHLEALRAEQELALERVDAEAQVLEAWRDLETAYGAPLLGWHLAEAPAERPAAQPPALLQDGSEDDGKEVER